ncbi:MAG: lpxK [Myxococcaceae bacterium]|nr:lpxK [Myxococcaceae bacterium]
MRSWLERLWYPQADRALSHALATPGLAIASALFAGAAAAHRLLSPGPQTIEGARVVSIGNLNVGGAGKTPVVIFLAQLAQQHGKRVAVLSRGHGRASTRPLAFDATALPAEPECGDEPRLIAARCPGVRVFVGADRLASARAARAEGCDWLLLDDGFQHRRLARDVDLVVVDDEVLFGTGHRLPWGPLRESPAALSRASLVWRRAAADGSPRSPLHPHELRAAHRVRAPQSLQGQRVLVLTGIARPSSVVQSAELLGARVVATRFFSDHHRFTAAQLAEVEAAARAHQAIVVTTEKDAQRLPAGFALALVVEIELLEGQPGLLAALGLEGRRSA